MKYIIMGESSTGATGHGDSGLPKEDAVHICKYLNKEFPDIRHWPEVMEDK